MPCWRPIPQQRAAPVRDALADRLLLYRQHAALRTEDMQRFAGRIYPYIAAELFAPLGARQEVACGDRRARSQRSRLWDCWSGRAATAGGGPAPNTAAAMELSLLAQATVQTIERYYLAIALLSAQGAVRSRPRRSKSAVS